MVKENALEIGCGVYPKEDRRMSRDRLDVKTDINLNYLLQLKGEDCNGVLVAADATHLPFKSETFQHIESHHVLEHVPDSHAFLKEISRVILAGGDVEIAVPHPLFETIMAFTLLGYYPYWSQQNHVHVYTPRTLKSIVADSGFNINNVQTKGWWRAVATIKNYITARINKESIHGHTQRLVSNRQRKLLLKRSQFLQTVSHMDESMNLLNKVIPYETVVRGTKT